MKKTLYLSLGLLLLTASGGWAYDFNDNTLVQYWNGNSAVAGWGWTDVIGNTSVYDTLGANWNGSKLSIFTNWNPGKDGDLGISGIKTADLFIFSNGTTYAIRLDTIGQGSVYINPPLSTSQGTSQALMAPYSNLIIYGGRYNQTSPSLVPVQGTGIPTDSANVSWNLGTGGLNNKVDVNLSGLVLGDQWSFVWGTATCGNDVFEGQVNTAVPEPGSMLLLGLGFVGLGAYGRRVVRK